MQNTETWINIKASKLGRCFFLFGYAGLISVIIDYSQPLINGLIIFVLLHAGWSWRQAFGSAAPVAFLIENHQLYVQLASGQLQTVQPPLLISSRFALVFKRSGLFVWPWLLWPDAISAKEHHQLRYFLRSWR
ncbi:MAG TPA: hypothetical protein VJY63_03600 [Marinospirillum sp.]|uniref:hypothetical protein n=1 Tax=Marinospirillum sp. TaxID=2183934 RepID=UPI002B4767E6|nr:hypothetical protein [Marinospirillum sp.]HKM14996.1 hypothetical protein [Marinospirillum sp.]